MERENCYPLRCLKSIRRITKALGVDMETAYSMMLMNSALMDLQPEDDAIVDMILEDCGIVPDVSA